MTIETWVMTVLGAFIAGWILGKHVGWNAACKRQADLERKAELEWDERGRGDD